MLRSNFVLPRNDGWGMTVRLLYWLAHIPLFARTGYCRARGRRICMKGSPLAWQITLSASECERSKLAMDAIGRMKSKEDL